MWRRTLLIQMAEDAPSVFTVDNITPHSPHSDSVLIQQVSLPSTLSTNGALLMKIAAIEAHRPQKPQSWVLSSFRPKLSEVTPALGGWSRD